MARARPGVSTQNFAAKEPHKHDPIPALSKTVPKEKSKGVVKATKGKIK
jgi:hypothetical protein